MGFRVPRQVVTTCSNVPENFVSAATSTGVMDYTRTPTTNETPHNSKT